MTPCLTSRSRRPAARRRPLRRRPEQGPRRRRSTRWPRPASAYLGTSHRQAPVRDVVGRVRDGLRRAVLAARRLRGRARQRRRDGVLGRRDVRPDPRAQPAPVVRRVLGEVRRRAASAAPFLGEPTVVTADPGTRPDAARRGRRRRLRLAAQRDLDRRDGAGPTGRRRRRRRAGADRRDVGRRRPPGRRQRDRRLLLRAAEVLRRPTAASGSR